MTIILKVDNLISYAVFFNLIDLIYTLKCYQCDVSPSYRADRNMTTPLCLKFEETNEFVVECPYSTMCLKKVLQLELQNGQTIETVTRGCASQKYTDQVFQKGAWRREHKVEEPYTEGCKAFNENMLAASTTTYCHCRGNYCNSAQSKDTNSYHTDAMAVIFVFNAMKYLRSGTAYW